MNEEQAIWSMEDLHAQIDQIIDEVRVILEKANRAEIDGHVYSPALQDYHTVMGHLFDDLYEARKHLAEALDYQRNEHP